MDQEIDCSKGGCVLFLEPTAFLRGDPELEPRRKPDLPLTSLALVRGLADSSFFPPSLKPRC